MMIEGQRKHRSKSLRRARRAMQTLSETCEPEPLVTAINRNLASAQVGYEALDPFGTRTALEIWDEITQLVTAAHVRRACLHHAHLATSPTPTLVVSLVVQALSKAKAGYDVLDRSGKKSTADIINEMLQLGGEHLDPYLALKLKSDARDATRSIASKAAWETANRGSKPPTAVAAQKRSRASQSSDAARRRLIQKIIQKGQTARL